MSAPERLPNGLTPEQDAAFEELARAIDLHLNPAPATRTPEESPDE